jgi:hypothetical protein
LKSVDASQKMEKGEPQILSMRMKGFDEDELTRELREKTTTSSSEDRDSPDSTPRYSPSRSIRIRIFIRIHVHPDSITYADSDPSGLKSIFGSRSSRI